jgi:DNA segregation ATPase FtsK/SpoIIIE, S-DNA-T family
MQNIILGIACTNTPEQARIVLIDPKLGVDYFTFEGLPHLEGGIIDEQQRAVAKLGELVDEMVSVSWCRLNKLLGPSRLHRD